ncbi:hypothetical protein C8Q80DRAFT_1104595 [Daedaleopsis nitida]|nr:hypothetical protein C8Q80DRAFT_1104595 [Daedaleopsis nitida]
MAQPQTLPSTTAPQIAPSVAPGPPPPPPPPPPQAPDDPVDAPFQNGAVPPVNSRPKVSDYIDPVRSLILSAIDYYSCSVLTVDAFPSDAKQEDLVRRAWIDACAHSDHPVRYRLSDRMKRLIGKRKSNARGDASDLIRPQTGSTYKFRDGTTLSNERYNVALYVKLTDKGAFHHKGIDDATGKLTGFAQHPYISQALRHAFFRDPRNGIGFRFPDAFNPIRTETVALVLTIIRFHIEEWATGKHVPGHFKEVEYAGTYRDIIKDLKKWSRSREDVWENIRYKWYKRAYRAGGGTLTQASDVRVPDEVMEEAQAELDGRTGLTDSEGEDGDHEELGNGGSLNDGE